jgi:segregation and condensation protein A
MHNVKDIIDDSKLSFQSETQVTADAEAQAPDFLSQDVSVFEVAEEAPKNPQKTYVVLKEPEEQKPYGERTYYETETDFLSGRKNYKYYVSHFEGPLDLISDMLLKEEIAIEDFFLSDVTSLYLDIIRNAELTVDMDYAGEFITTMAHLLYIKSLRLLPVENESVQIEVEALEKDFENLLKEYNMLKEQSQKIKLYETINSFYRQPEYSEKDYRLAIKNFSLDKMIDAFALLVSRLDRREEDKEVKIVHREKYSVANRMSYISMKVFSEKKASFYSLFEEDFGRADICNTFFAILELVKRQHIIIDQSEAFGDINIIIGEGVEAPIYLEEAENQMKAETKEEK